MNSTSVPSLDPNCNHLFIKQIFMKHLPGWAKESDAGSVSPCPPSTLPWDGDPHTESSSSDTTQGVQPRGRGQPAVGATGSEDRRDRNRERFPFSRTCHIQPLPPSLPPSNARSASASSSSNQPEFLA